MQGIRETMILFPTRHFLFLEDSLFDVPVTDSFVERPTQQKDMSNSPDSDTRGSSEEKNTTRTALTP